LRRMLACRIGLPAVRATSAFPNNSTTRKDDQAVRNIRVAAAAEGRNLHFTTHFKTDFGESLRLVGTPVELGEWDIGRSPEMHWSDGDVWAADIYVDGTDPFDFKAVHVTQDGNGHWEPGFNQSFSPVSDLMEYDIQATWGYPDLLTVEPAAAEDEVVSSDVDPEAQEPNASFPAPSNGAPVKLPTLNGASHSAAAPVKAGELELAEANGTVA